MSHFSQLKTNLKNQTYLKQALTKLGYQIEESPEGVDVRGYFGESLKADFKILTSTHYDIGFVKNTEGNYEVVGDWELLPKVSGIEQEAFMGQVKKEYARTSIIETAKEKGFGVETTENEETGELEIVVTQW